MPCPCLRCTCSVLCFAPLCNYCNLQRTSYSAGSVMCSTTSEATSNENKHTIKSRLATLADLARTKSYLITTSRRQGGKRQKMSAVRSSQHQVEEFEVKPVTTECPLREVATRDTSREERPLREVATRVERIVEKSQRPMWEVATRVKKSDCTSEISSI